GNPTFRGARYWPLYWRGLARKQPARGRSAHVGEAAARRNFRSAGARAIEPLALAAVAPLFDLIEMREHVEHAWPLFPAQSHHRTDDADFLARDRPLRHRRRRLIRDGLRHLPERTRVSETFRRRLEHDRCGRAGVGIGTRKAKRRALPAHARGEGDVGIVG